jgi:hypothetical protein
LFFNATTDRQLCSPFFLATSTRLADWFIHSFSSTAAQQPAAAAAAAAAAASSGSSGSGNWFIHSSIQSGFLRLSVFN